MFKEGKIFGQCFSLLFTKTKGRHLYVQPGSQGYGGLNEPVQPVGLYPLSLSIKEGGGKGPGLLRHKTLLLFQLPYNQGDYLPSHGRDTPLYLSQLYSNVLSQFLPHLRVIPPELEEQGALLLHLGHALHLGTVGQG